VFPVDLRSKAHAFGPPAFYLQEFVGGEMILGKFAQDNARNCSTASG
jgi:hypothetical protein